MWHWTRLLVGFGVIVSLLVLYLVAKILRITREIKAAPPPVVILPPAEPLPPHLDLANLQREHDATRSHMSHEMDSVRQATQSTRSNSQYVVDVVMKLAKGFGIAVPARPGDSVPPRPEERE